MKLYYNLTNQCRVDEDNCRLTDFPVIYYGTAPVWELQLYQGPLGTEPDVPDVSGLTAWRAAIDTDWTSGTAPMCRTVEGIDFSRAADGLLTIPLNANTITFADALNGKKSLNGFFELRGFNPQGAVESIILFGVTLHNAIDPEGGVSPETVSPDTITRAEVVACLRAPDERQYTSDPADPSAAHTVQTGSDTHTRRRNSSAAGEWGPWEALISGPQGNAGADGRLTGASQTVSSLSSGYIEVTHDAIPVSIKTDLDNIYPIEKDTMYFSSGAWYIDPAVYLEYDDVSSFTGPWTVYFAGGLPEVQTIISASTSITPQEHQVYQHTIASGETISIDTSALSSSVCVTFELWLDMPSTAVSFTLPSFTWIEGAAPDFTSGSMRYVITVRWNGTKFLANLAYTESLA